MTMSNIPTTFLVTGLAASAGIVAHLGIFIHGEWHMYGLTIAGAHCLAFSMLWYFATTGVLDTCCTTVSLISSYLLGLFGSIITYRLCFHRLRSFPGPKLFAISKLVHVFYNRSSKGHKVMEKLYRTYGPIVRTGPNELQIFTENAIDIMYTGKNTSNSPFYDIVTKNSCIFSRTIEENRTRRRAFVKGLSRVDLYHDRLITQISLLLDFIDRHGEQAMDVGKLSHQYTYDFMGRIVFNIEFGNLGQAKTSEEIKAQYLALSILGPLSPVPWLIILTLSLGKVLRGLPIIRKSALGAWWSMEDTADRYIERQSISQTDDPQTYCVAAEFVSEYRNGLTDHNKREKRLLLEGNSLTAMVGASDTTSHAIKALLYHLAQHPSCTNKLRKEVGRLSLDNYDLLKGQPYLNAFINESMRLIPVAGTFGFRETPSEGLKIISPALPGGTVYLPGNITLCTSRWTLGRLENAWERPLEFLPERWLEPGLVRHNASRPFAAGQRQCPGQDVALRHLRMLVTAVIQRYHIDFSPETKVASIEESSETGMTTALGSFNIVFRRL